MDIYERATRMVANSTLSFLLVVTIFLGMPATTHASGFECDPNPTPDMQSAYFSYSGADYLSGNLSFGFGVASTTGAGYYIDVRAYDDSCNLIIPANPRRIPIPAAVTAFHVRFVTASEFDVIDDATGALLYSEAYMGMPSYARVVVRVTPDFAMMGDGLDTSAVTLSANAVPPIVIGQTIATDPACPLRSVGHGRYLDYFDTDYERSVYVNGLLRIQLRLKASGMFDSIQTAGADQYDSACNPITASERNVLLDSAHYSRYFSFRMTDQTHWLLWDDDRDAAMSCSGCSRALAPGTARVSFMVYNSGDGIVPHYVYTTSYPPTKAGYCFSDCNSNVLFLPGTQASRLYAPGFPFETKLWEPINNGDVQALFLNPLGESVASDIYTKEGDVVDELEVPIIGANIYKSFIDRMNGLKAAGKINDWEAVPYDWRLSLDDNLTRGTDSNGHINYSDASQATSTPYIIQELRRLAASSKTGKVTIVAHSNGGLVAKRLTELLGPEASVLIDKMIFVAVPQVGTPMTVLSAEHGYKLDHILGLVVSKGMARTFASTSPMTYNLLPSSSYFAYVHTPVITFDQSLPDWIARYGSSISSEGQLQNFLTDTYGKVDSQTGDINQPIQLNSGLLSGAQALHSNLDNWSIPSGIKLIQIAGWGVPKTPSGMTYAKNGAGVKSGVAFTLDGDGMVVTPSALWMSTTVGAENYWLDIRRYNLRPENLFALGFLSIDHSNILEIPDFLNFISDQITNKIKPLFAYNYLSTSTPATSGARLRYSLHSPLTLNLYDDQGNHTGVSTTTGEVEEQIPGTYYTEFGDVKYIFSDASSTAHIVMDGYAAGMFTFNADQYQGDTLTASTTFRDIPTTPQAHVTLDVQSDISTLSPMHVDLNGDGVIDFNLVPKANDVVTSDIVPPVTHATPSGPLGSNGWYRGGVVVALNATDTGSGVKNIYFSLDGAATTTGTTTTITLAGIHLIRFYSDDMAGNIESATSTTIKIDMTPPEAILSFDPVLKDLGMIGTDALSSTTITRTATTTIIIDQAGNGTRLNFQKTYSGKFLTLARLVSIQYGTSTTAALPTSFAYIYDSAQVLVSQTLVADSQFIIEALYDKKSNKTTIIVLKKGIPIQTKSVSGQTLLILTTSKGTVGYGW
jgi:pimeloyl-ACP methyl ester carboxylesterase